MKYFRIYLRKNLQVGSRVKGRRAEGCLFNPVDDKLTVKSIRRVDIRECDLPRTDGHEGCTHANSTDVALTRMIFVLEDFEGELHEKEAWASNLLDKPEPVS